MSLTTIIVAAGNSRRMGFDKLLAPLSGKPVLEHTIEAFHSCPCVDHIILVCPEQRAAELSLNLTGKKIHRTDGGTDRHDSVAAGLALVPEGTRYIAVHDGARPLISPAQISNVLSMAKQHQCAASARQITETVKRADAEHFVTEPVSRENLWLMETPQIFRRDLLEEAYQHVQHSGERVTDEVSALEFIGHRTYLVNNTTPNPKITFPEDISLATLLLEDPNSITNC